METGAPPPPPPCSRSPGSRWAAARGCRGRKGSAAKPVWPSPQPKWLFAAPRRAPLAIAHLPHRAWGAARRPSGRPNPAPRSPRPGTRTRSPRPGRPTSPLGRPPGPEPGRAAHTWSGRGWRAERAAGREDGARRRRGGRAAAVSLAPSRPAPTLFNRGRPRADTPHGLTAWLRRPGQ